MGRTLLFLMSVFTCLSFSSCSLVIRKIIGLHDPVVETHYTISAFIIESGKTFDYNYIIKSKTDSTSIFKNLFLCGANQIMLFDSMGTRLYYENQDSMSCQGNLYKIAFNNPQIFKAGLNDTVCLHDYLNRYTPITTNGDPEWDAVRITPSSFYLVYYWSKFMGGRRKYIDEIKRLQELQMKSNFKISIIGVNTDLQEDWGLIPGKKMKMKLKIRGHGGTADFGPLPYKKQDSII